MTIIIIIIIIIIVIIIIMIKQIISRVLSLKKFRSDRYLSAAGLPHTSPEASSHGFFKLSSRTESLIFNCEE